MTQSQSTSPPAPQQAEIVPHQLAWACVRDDDEFDIQDFEAQVPGGVYQIGVNGLEIIWGYEFGDPDNPDEEEFFEAESFEAAVAAAQEHWELVRWIEVVDQKSEKQESEGVG